jgi:microcystin degradation protein MlrC
MMWDPIAHHLARSAGPGARMALRLGGKMGPTSGDPLDLDVTVVGLIDGLVVRGPRPRVDRQPRRRRGAPARPRLRRRR